MDFSANINTSTINKALSNLELSSIEKDVNQLNGELVAERKRVFKNELGKSDFLTILIQQLSNQDPTAPMEDKQFISQMAQFSSLEQMSNMSQGFDKLSSMIKASNSVNLIGKNVSVEAGDGVVEGVVTEILGSDAPQLKINGKYYELSKMISVKNNIEE